MFLSAGLRVRETQELSQPVYLRPVAQIKFLAGTQFLLAANLAFYPHGPQNFAPSANSSRPATGLKHTDSSQYRSFSSLRVPKNASKTATRERFFRQITIESCLGNRPSKPYFLFPMALSSQSRMRAFEMMAAPIWQCSSAPSSLVKSR